MTKPKPRSTRPAAAHRTERQRARFIRTAKTGAAATAIGPVAPGMEVFILTFGRFSLVDALAHLVQQVGPCDIAISTWTAADADLRLIASLRDQAKIRAVRWLVDGSYIARQPASCATMRELFGDGAIRTLSNHAKFITIRTDDYALAVRSTMNMNDNPRLETLEISDDDNLCDFLEGVVDQLYAERPEGDFGFAMPRLASTADAGAVASPISRVGRVRL